MSGGGRGGFFVVGGKRQGNERRRSLIGPRGRATGSAGNTASATNAAGIGAGLMAAALGARSPGRRGTAAQEDDTEEVLLDGEADADEGAGEMAERRGLMDFMAERPSGDDPSEMSQAGPGPSRFPWGAAALGAGAAGAGMYAATRDRDQGTGMTPSTSNNSNSGPASSHRHSSSAGQAPSSSGGRNSSSDPQSSNSTGVLTGPGSSGTSLPPPPRAPRTPGTSSSVFGNLPPSSSESVSPSLDVPEEYGAGRKPRIPSFHGGFGSGDLGELATALDTDRGVPRSSGETFDSDHHSGLAPALAGAAAAGGLSALAAGHRESGGSTYSRGFYPSGVSSNGNGSSSEQVAGPSNLAPPFTPSSRPSAPRHSHFISSGTPLLGPGAAATGADSGEERDDPNAPTHTYGNLQPGSSNLLYPTAGRLPTIRSVGEFGERSGSEGRTPVRSLQSASSFGGPSGSGSGSGSVSGSGRPNTVEEGLAAGTATAAGTNEAQPGFFTPPHTPRGTLGRPRSMHSLASGGSRGGLSGQSSVGRSAVARESSLLRSDADSDWVETDAEAEGVDPAAGQSEEVGHGGPEEASLNDHDAAGAAFGGELLGGMAAGWRRLTMGQYAFFPGGPSGQPQEESAPLEASEPTAQGARHDPAQASDPGLAAEVRSEHASVYGNSALGHSGGGTPRTHSHNASRHGSGENSSGPAEEGAAGLVPGRRYADRSVGSGSGHSSSRSQQGYTASVSNTSVSGSGSAAGGSGSCGDASSAISSGLSSLSQRTHLTSSGNASSSGRSRRGGSHSGSASGASSGGASYSPSHLVARSTISTRGGSLSSRGSRSWTRSAHADGSVVSDAEGSSSGGTDSEGNSSHATAGSTTGQRGGKRRRSASLDGLSRLDSVREGGPGSADEEGEGPFAFRYGHYPSPSLGAAAFRQAYRTMGSPQEVASSPELTSEHQTPRAHPVALQPSSEVPLPATMPASVSDPILNAATSDTWRPSPRVTSAAQRAAAAQAHLETQRAEAFSNAQQGLARHGVTGPPAAAADTPATPPSRSEYVWGDLAQLGSPNRLRSPERGAEQGEAGPQPEEQPQPTERGIWPGFLRF